MSLPPETPFTLSDAHEAVGHRWPDGTLRLAWCDQRGRRDPVVLVRVKLETGAIYVCAAEGDSPDGHWTTVDGLRRRADLDRSPLPSWLLRVMSSSKAPLHVYSDILNPEYSSRELTSQVDVDEFTYRSYRHQRVVLSPDVAPERWAAIYGDQVEAFEARLQRELAVPSSLLAVSVRVEREAVR